MLGHKGSQPIRTERLLLRPFALSDAQAMFNNWAGDEKATRYLRFNPHRSVAETEDYLRACVSRYCKPNRYHWAITLDGEAIGAIAAYVEDIDYRSDVA